ncbi:hypothetical protein ACLOAV_007266 [Pseudogymnoascus australis]
MAPFNHFGAVFSTPSPPVSPPSTKRSVRERNVQRDVLVEAAPKAPRNSKSRRRRRLSPRQRPAEVDTDSEDSVGVTSGEDSDDAPEEKDTGILGDAITGVGSVIDSAIDPILGGQSSTAVEEPKKSTAVEEPEESSATKVESEPTPIATTESESSADAITSSELSSAAVETSKPIIISTTPTPHSSKVPDDLSSAVALPGTTGVLTAEAAAIPSPSKVGSLTRFTPEVTRTFPTPTAQLQSADRASLGKSQATGAAGQKAQGQSIDSTVSAEPDSDSDSDNGVESGDETDDDLESDDEEDPTESRLVAFTTISGTPLSTLSAVLDPTAVGALPNSVTPVSQTGGQTTVASASANKPALTPQASNGLIAFGAVGGVLFLSFIIYILVRFRKTGAFGCLCCGSKRKSESDASKSLYHKSGIFGTSAPSETQTHSRGFSAFFNPMIQIRAAEYGKEPGQGQPYSRNSLIQNAAPIAVSQQPMPVTKDDPPPMPVLPQAYRQAANGKTQRMSELSSLSSGFGDAVIDIPESGPTTYNSNRPGPGLPKPNNQILGVDLGSRFSWANVPTPRTLGTHRNRNRDTATTTTSQDSEPRFRTVTSWVNQQTNRVMKHQDGGAAAPGQDKDSVPDLPAIPAAYGGNHQRVPSAETDVVFKAHPGDEVEIKESSRIPSTLLTRKLRL